MDHEVSGKRHMRDGSVTVAELIGRQPYFVAGPSAAEFESQAADNTSASKTAQLTPEDGDPRPSLRARIIALAVGTVALLGAVGATAAISGAQPAQPTAHNQDGSAPITGASALRPDLLAQRLGYLPPRAPFLLADTGLPATRMAAPAPATPSTQADASASPSPSGGSPTSSAAPPAAERSTVHYTTNGQQQPADVIREFYRRLRDKSGDAQALLDPALLGADLPGFESSWRSVRAVEPIAVVPQSDGSVLGTVAFQQQNGTWLRLQQHFSLNGARPPVIDRVELVSAQQS